LQRLIVKYMFRVTTRTLTSKRGIVSDMKKGKEK
jgi:hypothetical protein